MLDRRAVALTDAGVGEGQITPDHRAADACVETRTHEGVAIVLRGERIDFEA